MKYLMIVLAVLSLATACSSAKEKHNQRQADARQEYNEAMKESQEEYNDDVVDEKKEEAVEMIDESDDVKVNDDSIDLED